VCSTTSHNCDWDNVACMQLQGVARRCSDMDVVVPLFGAQYGICLAYASALTFSISHVAVRAMAKGRGGMEAKVCH